MTLDQFKAIDAECRTTKPNLFNMTSPARCASERMIEETEAALELALSEKYRQFLAAFGGGEFGLVNIFCADGENEWYLPRKQREAMITLPSGYLAFSDDCAGGYYVMKIVNSMVQDDVLYWNYEEQTESKTPFRDLFEFIAKYAYEPA